jgi:hypothetical protein
MTEQEVRETVRLHGWSLLRRERKSRSYMYAARKVQGARKEVYLAPFAKLTQLTLDQITQKLTSIVAVSPVAQFKERKDCAL